MTCEMCGTAITVRESDDGLCPECLIDDLVEFEA